MAWLCRPRCDGNETQAWLSAAPAGDGAKEAAPAVQLTPEMEEMVAAGIITEEQAIEMMGGAPPSPPHAGATAEDSVDGDASDLCRLGFGPLEGALGRPRHCWPRFEAPAPEGGNRESACLVGVYRVVRASAVVLAPQYWR